VAAADITDAISTLEAKIAEYAGTSAPKVTLPGGVVIDTAEYLDGLIKMLEALRKLQGPFTATSVAR
jgi:hypothetical protein